tara:strand:+ start:17 stop:616 length:600 start_codon:yes stop_codon:yes gene_type:complete
MDWWGYNSSRGWVFLDRNIPNNAAGVKNNLLFVDCNKEIAYFDAWDQWKQPRYTAFKPHFDRLIGAQKEVALNELSALQEKTVLFRELAVSAFYDNCSGSYYNPFSHVKNKTDLYEIYSEAWSRKDREKSQNAHRDFISKIGKIYYGTSKSIQVKNHRVTNCYSCQKKLDSSIDLECNACKWIICTCGACGCGWSGHYL